MFDFYLKGKHFFNRLAKKLDFRVANHLINQLIVAALVSLMSPFQKSMASNVVSVKVTVYLTSLTVLCWHVDHRVSRRWVVPTSGRRSRKVWRAQRGRPCTPLSPSPKVEKNWAEPVHSRPSLRSGETTLHPQVSKISPFKWERLRRSNACCLCRVWRPWRRR